MVAYKLIDIDDEGRLLYEYALENSYNPDGTLKFEKPSALDTLEGGLGLAALDPNTGKAFIVKQAPEGFGWHEGHLLHALEREFSKTGEAPRTGGTAWY